MGGLALRGLLLLSICNDRLINGNPRVLILTKEIRDAAYYNLLFKYLMRKVRKIDYDPNMLGIRRIPILIKQQENKGALHIGRIGNRTYANYYELRKSGNYKMRLHVLLKRISVNMYRSNNPFIIIDTQKREEITPFVDWIYKETDYTSALEEAMFCDLDLHEFITKIGENIGLNTLERDYLKSDIVKSRLTYIRDQLSIRFEGVVNDYTKHIDKMLELLRVKHNKDYNILL